MSIKYWNFALSNISSKCQIGDGSIIHPFVSIYDNVVIGERCQIEEKATLFEGVILEDDVFIGPHVVFTNDPTMALERKKWAPTPTLVKKGVKIGANVTIRAGIVIGEKAIIGCGSVVLNNVPAGETWAGNPAKKIK